MDLKLTTDVSLEAALSPLITTRQDLKARIAALEAQVDDINDDIKTTLVNAGQLEVRVDGMNVVLDMEAEKASLDKHLLLEQGVTTEQIKAATKKTAYIKLDVRKAAKEKA